jgi:hypothetical protein
MRHTPDPISVAVDQIEQLRRHLTRARPEQYVWPLWARALLVWHQLAAGRRAGVAPAFIISKSDQAWGSSFVMSHQRSRDGRSGMGLCQCAL